MTDFSFLGEISLVALNVKSLMNMWVPFLNRNWTIYQLFFNVLTEPFYFLSLMHSC